jgi:two-component system NtrC family sensor kinase
VFLTRSIRRKLMLSLALVCAMVGLLAYGAISGLSSYRSVVNDLDYTITVAPRNGDLLTAIGLLYQPLLLPEPKFAEDDDLRQWLWNVKIDECREKIRSYLRRLDDIPRSQISSWQQRDTVNELLHNLDHDLFRLEHVVKQRRQIGDPTHDREPWQLVIEMAEKAAQIPSPEQHLGNKLDAAREVYRSRFYVVCTALVITVLLFLGLIRCGYLWIFFPIRKLHEGTLRVAAGDFDYRVKLTGKDEMAELAGTFNQVVETFQDIKSKLDNEVHERSRQLVRSERLAGVGFLAAGVAHEINNPLSAIAMAAESLEGRIHEPAFTDGHPAPDDLALVTQYLSMIQKEAFRCQQITARLLDFARGSDAPKTRQDLVKIVSDVLDLVAHLSKFRGHTITFDRQRTCYAEVNGAEIKQVILNLVANALESVEGRGVVKIELEERADEIVLSFRDNGCGMTPYVIENLFEPFFTERKSGKGTGLGLSISHRIVSEHGGRIEAQSDGPGKGSCFRIHLPRKAKSQLAHAA